MSFPIDDFGMNIRAEVKAFNFGFSPAKNLGSVIRTGDRPTDCHEDCRACGLPDYREYLYTPER